MSNPEPTVRPFKAEVSQLLKLVVNSLYSNKDVFLRELVSNASDALDKLRFASLQQPELLPEGSVLRVRISADPAEGTLTLADNGVGMSAAELEENLGTLARSGTRAFAEALEQSQGERPELIGRFGVGFYSAFLVADRVRVVSRAAGSNEAFAWESDAQESFSIEAASRPEQGTSVTLHLKEECKELLEDHRLRRLIERYSDYIPHSIEMLKAPEPESKDSPGEEAAKAPEEPQFERVNQASALWRRPSSELDDSQYEEFYKHLTHDWQGALAHKHFQVEGTQLFYAVLFVPKQPPFDLFDAEAKHGVRLHVRRVFVMDNCSELVPRYLRFIRGVVDSEDLPLNVSREILQDSSAVRVIRKQLVNHSLSMLENLRSEDKARYDEFWAQFGTVLKEGLHFEAGERERIAKLVQYQTSSAEGWSGLAEYVGRMKEGQNAIYYATGQSRELLEKSPHLEGLRRREYEVLYLTDPIDPFAVQSLSEFDGKPLVSAMTEDLKLDEADETEKEEETKPEALLTHFKEVLGDRVAAVKKSARLTDSPVCLVTGEGEMAPHIRELLKARKMDVPPSRRVLEVNLEHAAIENLGKAHAERGSSEDVAMWIQTLYDQALIAEGSQVEDPADFARRLTLLVQRATA